MTNHDIHNVIDAVQSELPTVEVTQMSKVHPADDDGLWWFRLPGVGQDIQIESSNYDCPFYVEHSSMKSSSEAITCLTVDETARVIIEYLKSVETTN